MGAGAILAILATPFRLLGRAVDWLLEKPIRAVLFLFAVHMAAHQFVIDPNLRSERDGWKATAGEWRKATFAWKGAHERLVRDVRTAREKAAEADRANVARVSREYQLIKERTADAYEARLADTRAALERLRHDLAAADAGGGIGDVGTAAVPATLTARCRAYGAADCDALLAALPGLLAAAEDNTAKLIGLQDYVASTLLIDFSGAERNP